MNSLTTKHDFKISSSLIKHQQTKESSRVLENVSRLVFAARFELNWSQIPRLTAGFVQSFLHLWLPCIWPHNALIGNTSNGKDLVSQKAINTLLKSWGTTFFYLSLCIKTFFSSSAVLSGAWIPQIPKSAMWVFYYLTVSDDCSISSLCTTCCLRVRLSLDLMSNPDDGWHFVPSASTFQAVRSAHSVY